MTTFHHFTSSKCAICESEEGTLEKVRDGDAVMVCQSCANYDEGSLVVDHFDDIQATKRALELPSAAGIVPFLNRAAFHASQIGRSPATQSQCDRLASLIDSLGDIATFERFSMGSGATLTAAQASKIIARLGIASIS